MARHGTAFFSSINTSEPKWAVLVEKNLRLVPLSLASFEDFVQKAMAAIWNDMETFKLVEMVKRVEAKELIEREASQTERSAT